MKLFTKLSVLPFFLTAVVWGSSLAADEPSSFPEVQKVENLDDKTLENPENTSEEAVSKGIFDSYYLGRLHADSFNHIFGYSWDGSTVEMLDGSKWNIATGQYLVTHWVKSDDIFIKPALWYASTKYVLHNYTLDETVEANLYDLPSYAGYTYNIINIDYYQGLIILSDNTVWQMNPSDNYSNWQIGDRVIVGVNNYWRTASYPQILINVEIALEPYCSAIFYGYPL